MTALMVPTLNKVLPHHAVNVRWDISKMFLEAQVAAFVVLVSMVQREQVLGVYPAVSEKCNQRWAQLLVRGAPLADIKEKLASFHAKSAQGGDTLMQRDHRHAWCAYLADMQNGMKKGLQGR